jgi:hypothetical protein
MFGKAERNRERERERERERGEEGGKGERVRRKGRERQGTDPGKPRESTSDSRKSAGNSHPRHDTASRE